MHRQPLEACRSVHQRVPWQARHHAPGHDGVASAQLGVRASPGGRSLILGLALRSIIMFSQSSVGYSAPAYPRLSRRWPEGAVGSGPPPFWTLHDRDRITAASRWRREPGWGARITGAVAQLPAAAGSALEPSKSELEVSLRHLVWQAQSLQRCSVFRHPLVTDGHQQHHASRLWVAYRGCVDPSLLGSDEPLQGAQWGGHG